jgi:hypothetical protein
VRVRLEACPHVGAKTVTVSPPEEAIECPCSQLASLVQDYALDTIWSVSPAHKLDASMGVSKNKKHDLVHLSVHF